MKLTEAQAAALQRVAAAADYAGAPRSLDALATLGLIERKDCGACVGCRHRIVCTTVSLGHSRCWRLTDAGRQTVECLAAAEEALARARTTT